MPETVDNQHTQDLILDPGAEELTFEQFAERNGLQHLLDAQLQTDQEPSAEQSPDDQAQTEAVDDYELDGERIPVDKLKEYVSKGRDYTRKTQELADQRRELEAQQASVKWVHELESHWNSGPEGRQRIIEALMAEAGYQPGAQPQPQAFVGDLNMDELSDEARAVVNSLSAQNRQLQAQLQNVTQQSTRAIKQFEDYIREQRGTDAATQAAANLRAEFGVDVSPQELRKLSTELGIEDHEAAWLKANKEQVKKGLFQAGHEQGARQKPSSPTGQNRTFDPDAPGMTADKIFKFLQAGYQMKK